MKKGIFLFDNLFRSREFIPERLYKFGSLVIVALKADNSTNRFDNIIKLLDTALQALFAELTSIDSGISDQKIDTRSVDELVADFKEYMSGSEGEIRRKLGGGQSAGYLTFYPNRQSEYAKVNKTTMPVLAERVAKAAAKYGDKLDAEMVTELASFAPLFTEKHSEQQTKIQTVKTGRQERSTALTDTQLALTSAVYIVGAAYPGNQAKCLTFFPFAVLKPQTRRTFYIFEGSIEKNGTIELTNFTLNKMAVFTFANTGVNAGVALWRAALPTDPMPADPFVVNPTDAPLTIKASTLGDLDKEPFIMMKNLSDVNACSYKVSFTNVKKPMTGAKVEVEEENMEVIKETA